jgi:hypothetical protein
MGIVGALLARKILRVIVARMSRKEEAEEAENGI